jgi:hypothetical protein
MNLPDPLPVVDALFAATAKVSGLIFASRTIADVESAGVELLDPFSSPF